VRGTKIIIIIIITRGSQQTLLLWRFPGSARSSFWWR